MLLERTQPISQLTTKTWRTLTALAVTLGVAAFASQFGVAYAQESTKTKETKTNSEVRSADDADVFLTQAKTKVAERRESAKTPTVELALEPTQASSADSVRSGHAINDNLTLQVADRKAKLGAAKLTDLYQPEVLLRMELELLYLESAKRVADKESELLAVERRLLNLTMESEEAEAELGSGHPKQQKLAREAKAWNARRQLLKRMIEEESAMIEDKAKHLASEAKRAGALSPPAKNTMKQASNKNATLEDMLADITKRHDAADRQWRQTLAENENLKAQIAQLQKQATNPPTTPASSFEASLPMIRHRLRMAEAEPALLQSRMDLAETSLDRIGKLHKTGVISVEEVAKAEAALTEAKAALRKAQVEIESLKTLLKELDESKSTKKEAFNKATGVAR